MDPTLRPARAADIPAITAIYAESVLGGTASFETQAPTEAEMATRFAAIVSGGFPYLVAEGGARILGYAYAGPYRPRAAYGSSVEDSLYVAADARGLGIGRRLLSDLIAACTALDCRLMVAVIADPGSAYAGLADPGSAASVRLHAGLGFEQVGTLSGVGYKHGRWLDTVLMQRRLGPGPDAPPTRG
ncbi:GNAT family N-acetyltransferase [Methylobacterium trifolii]|uniref:L-methionine sulfoximine/L-methionine sulfone acetyltransferase n=1 Tax=Methylobacterium trifolii TaxID=1003092 RepID=A0ABQ4TV78_9HYPH|nr:GNAT family N-acetyltransferase [Methylobacterium trifolii]GJE59189.1 L-methionine sulfoximine/L-methionine sulfone acetyltransferase [Methylobacterium trifolii]